MSEMYLKAVAVVAMSAVLGVFVGGASAEPMLYDFSSVNAGPLNGYDGWVKETSTTKEFNTIVSGASGWSGNYVESTSTATDSASIRPNDLSWSFSLVNNVNFEFSAVVRAMGNSYVAYGGLSHSDFGATHKYLLTGVNNGRLYWAIGGVAYNSSTAGSTFAPATPAVNSKLLVGVTFIAKGDNVYDVQRWYEDLTSGGGRQNVGGLIESYDLKPGGGLSAYWERLYVRTSKSGSRVDDIFINQVPEPSTLALAGMGLLGLLAYAWRKRK